MCECKKHTCFECFFEFVWFFGSNATYNMCWNEWKHRLLHDYVTDLKKGDYIVQNVTDSDVAQSVIQIANKMGVKTINLIFTDNKSDQEIEKLRKCLYKIGATHVVLSHNVFKLNETQRKQLCENKLPKLGLNACGGACAESILQFMGPNSVMVTYGVMGNQPITMNTGAFISNNMTLRVTFNFLFL